MWLTFLRPRDRKLGWPTLWWWTRSREPFRWCHVARRYDPCARALPDRPRGATHTLSHECRGGVLEWAVLPVVVCGACPPTAVTSGSSLGSGTDQGLPPRGVGGAVALHTSRVLIRSPGAVHDDAGRVSLTCGMGGWVGREHSPRVVLPLRISFAAPALVLLSSPRPPGSCNELDGIGPDQPPRLSALS